MPSIKKPSRKKNRQPSRSVSTPHLSLAQAKRQVHRKFNTHHAKTTPTNHSPHAKPSNQTNILQHLRLLLQKAYSFLKKSYQAFMRSLTSWLDPRLEPYRITKFSAGQPNLTNLTTVPKFNDAASMSNIAAEIDHETSEVSDRTYQQEINQNRRELYTPKTTVDFLALLQRTPHTVLSQHERQTISTIINFPSYHVSDLMLPPQDIVYISADEVLGPLTLDRLYRSGFSHFPVTNARGQIIGLLHTTALNSLEIRETSTAKDLLDSKVYYVRADYNLNQAMAAFLRTNCYFFLVVDKFEHIVGMLTYQLLVNFLLGETPSDSFDRDDDRLAVAKRHLDAEQKLLAQKNQKLKLVVKMQDTSRE